MLSTLQILIKTACSAVLTLTTQQTMQPLKSTNDQIKDFAVALYL